MPLRVRFQYQSGSSLGISVEQLSTGSFYDFSTTSSTAQTFVALATAATPIDPLPEGTGILLGSYSLTFTSTPIAQWTNGYYAVRIHNTASSNITVGLLGSKFWDGDDQPSDDSTVAPDWFATGGSAPSAAAVATAILTDTTSTDLDTPGSLGYMIAHAPIWYVSSSGPTAAQIATAILTDTNATDLGVAGSLGSIISTAPSWYTSGGGSGGISLTTAVPLVNTPNSVGDCLNAARANGFGAWILAGNSLTLLGPDGMTPVRIFTLNNPQAPTQRT